MAELKQPTASDIVSDPKFQQALDLLEKGPTQPAKSDPPPSTEAANSGSSTDAASGTQPGLPERVVQAESAALEQDNEPEAQQQEGWIDADTIELAQSYGISEDRLKKFTSREDFDNMASFLDEQIKLTKGSPNPQAKVDPLGAPPDTSVITPTDPPPAGAPKNTDPPAKAKPEPAQQFDIEDLRKKGYDEDSLKLFEQVNAERLARAEVERQLQEQNEKLGQVVPFFEQLKQQQELEQRRHAQRLQYEYHSNVDQLSEARFGRAIDDQGKFSQITVEQKSNRDRLYATADAVARNIQTTGRPLPPMKVLLKRAEAIEFAQELVAEEAQKVRDGLKAQSSMRRPSGANKPVNGLAPPKPGAPINEQVRYIVNDPNFSRELDRLESESGAR